MPMITPVVAVVYVQLIILILLRLMVLFAAVEPAAFSIAVKACMVPPPLSVMVLYVTVAPALVAAPVKMPRNVFA